MNDEQVRHALRQGDPAEGEGGLTLDEIRAMRRTVLAAIPERRRRLWPVLAPAGAVATALLIAVFILRPGPAPETPGAPRTAALPAPLRQSNPIAQVPVQPVRQPLREEKRRPVHPQRQRHHRRPAATTAPDDALASREPAAPELRERQIHFSAPGGTQIIWILKSGKASR